MIHELPLGSTRLHGAFSRDLSPVVTVDPGDSVRFSLPNSGWRLGPDEEVERPDPAVDTGHALLGPIEVRGAHAGHVLAVHVDEVTPGGWGETFDETCCNCAEALWGWTVPVTAYPNFISLSSTECPPITTTPSAFIAACPPASMAPSTPASSALRSRRPM